jgi:hypothetical protein
MGTPRRNGPCCWEYIQRTFAQGNYDGLNTLPSDIAAGEVNKFRKAGGELRASTRTANGYAISSE